MNGVVEAVAPAPGACSRGEPCDPHKGGEAGNESAHSVAPEKRASWVRLLVAGIGERAGFASARLMRQAWYRVGEKGPTGFLQIRVELGLGEAGSGIKGGASG